MMNSNSPTVEMYTKPGCVQCVATERWLLSNNVTFIKHDVSTDAAAYEYVTSLGYQAVPVLVRADGNHWYGFNPMELSQLI